MDSSNLESCILNTNSSTEQILSTSLVSLEAEIPEVLYKGMKEFISSNPSLDQYGVMSSAVANFLFQNGCEDRSVTEQYLNDVFILSENQ
tara:strand:- start:162 stop:431 length:270 start_codon:yes stop_codon:yes gene_type:complete